MKQFICCILVLTILTGTQAQRHPNLSELIEKQCNKTAVYLSLSSGVYYLHEMVVVQDKEELILVGNNNTIVECSENQNTTSRDHKYVLIVRNVSRILFEGITFRNCNKNIKVRVPPSATEGYFFFKKCDSVRVHNCSFINIGGINLLCYNTLDLKVTDSVFQNSYRPSKAMLLFVNETEKQFTTLEVRRNRFEGEKWTSGYNSESDHANFAVKCGGAVSAYISTEVNVSIQIVDNLFRDNKGTHGGAICVWVSENVSQPNITISEGNFVEGQATTRSDAETYHERPGGGAIALFLFARGTELLISNCNFTNNRGYRGGALYIDYSEGPGLTHIKNCNFEGNRGRLGGAIMITTALIPDQVYVTSTNNTFTRNTADEFGGAILALRVSIDMRDDNIIANNVVKYGDGGGMGLVYSHVLVNGSFQVLNNTANRGGGGVYITSQGKISMGRRGNVLNISGNTAKMYGGGLFAYSQNYEYTFVQNILPERENFERACFLRGHRYATIAMLGNKVKNDNKACSGNAVYTQLLGKCMTDKIMQGELIMDKSECNRDTRETSFNLEIDPIISLKCNKSLFQIHYDDGVSVNFLKYCKAKGKSTVNPFTKREYQIPLKMINEFHNAHNNITDFHYIYPGYTTTLNVSSRDYFNNSVVTRANLSAIIYSDGKKYRRSQKTKLVRFGLISDSAESVPFLTNLSKPIMLKSEWFGLGVICVKSIGGYTQIEKCIGIIMGKCPPGFVQKGNKCVCWESHWFKCNNKNQIIMKPGLYMANKYSFDDARIGMHAAICLWYRCKCHSGAPKSICTIDPMKPDEQCYSGLTGPLCGTCSNPNETLLHSPFLSVNVDRNCFNCTQPALKIAIVIFILVVISVLIILFQTNFFEDYLRSIIFYANILYVILANSNIYISPVVYKVFLLTVLPLNLLVTQFMPFCIYPQNNPILVTIFQMSVPSTVLLLFLGLQFLLIKYSCFSKRDTPIQIFTLILLTYTDLSIHSFMILNCPQIVNTRYWLFQGNTVCFEKLHLRATFLSVFVIFILIAIPCFLLFITYCTKKADFRFIEPITNTNYFKREYRSWEIYKLFLRLIIAFILSWLTNFIDSNVPNIIVCIICFCNVIFNSLCQPAVNERSNHFESFCFLCLGYIVIPQKNGYVNIIAPLPFIVGPIGYILEKKIQLWIAKYNKIKTNWGQLTMKELWIIWDANSVHVL